MYLRGSTFYYVSADGKWHNLGKVKARALRLWAELECLPPHVTVADLVHRYLDDCMADYAKSTRNRYADYSRTIDAEFGTLPADDLSRFAIARWRDSGRVKRGWFNGCLSLLRVAYRIGGEWGWVTTNEAEHVNFNETTPRGRRITDDEFRRIREISPRWLQIAMDLAYLTSMRESDVLGLRWAAVGERLSVVQVKTGARQAFEITPPLRAVLEAAKRIPIVGLFVVSTDKGRPITGRRLQEAFATARDAASVERDTRFHDIRGMSATTAEEEGLDYQAMLGHTSKKMSDRYIKRLRTINAPTLKRRL
jgi:integrase